MSLTDPAFAVNPVIGPGPAMPVIGPGPAMPVIGPGPAMPVIGPGPAMPVIGPGPAMPAMRRDLQAQLRRARAEREAARAVRSAEASRRRHAHPYAALPEIPGVVYLVHLNAPVCPWRPARHYIGTAISLESRLAEHRAGTGARMLAAANERGIDYAVVRTWSGGRTRERELKRRHDAPALCPLCRQARQVRHA